MKTLIVTLAIFVSLTIKAQLPLLQIGEKLPLETTNMKCATTNKEYSMKSEKKENGIIVIFSCNTCPFVVAWEDRYHTVSNLAKENKIGFVLINSNAAKRDNTDSWESMKEHAIKHKYQWPYLYDDGNKIADAFGAQTTPHVYMFDANNKLVYKGSIDDNHKDAQQVTKFYLKDAILQHVSGKEVANKETRNLGCSIKRITN
jgi:thioredoxin-related protein